MPQSVFVKSIVMGVHNCTGQFEKCQVIYTCKTSKQLFYCKYTLE